MKCPQYVKVGDRLYKINTDYRVAIRCEEIAQDNSISDFERALGIICTLFGEEALDNPKNYEKLLELAQKYLSCGKEQIDSKEKPDMDYIQDMDLIEASFMSDYHIDLSKENMHWWKFNNLMNGLSYSEFGNCCILNTIRNLRGIDAKDIQDSKERKRIIEAQKFWALDKEENHLSAEQEKSMEELNKILFGKE